MRVLRVCLTGSECTGKTTLARGLAARFGAAWLPEFAREYAERHNNELSARTVGPIAEGHLAAEAAALWAMGENVQNDCGRKLLLLDADLISTVVYSRYYYGGCAGWIERAARAGRADVYLLCGTDVPWQADGIRDLPGAREEVQERFRQALAEFGCSVVELRGGAEARLAAAGEVVERLIRQ